MTSDIKEKISRIIKNPPLKEAEGAFFFIPMEMNNPSRDAERDGFRQIIKKKTPKLYEFIVMLMSTLFEQGIGISKALMIAFPYGYSEKIVINIGSGTKRIGRDIINLDCYPYNGVDIVANATHLPFDDGSVDMIISVSLLEHVPEPEKVLMEIGRVLKRGGYFYCSIPFLYPFHSAPNDYSRFTLGWFRYRLNDFTVVRSGVDAGPMTALTISLAYIIALIFSFGSRLWYALLRDFFILLFVPLRIFDFVLSTFPFAEDIAASLYVFARKNEKI